MELKPCPFCGGIGMFRLKNIVDDDSNWIYCIKCGIETKIFSTKEEAAEMWNRRIDNE